MSSFLNSISLFIARQADPALQANARQSLASTGGSSSKQAWQRAPLGSHDGDGRAIESTRSHGLDEPSDEALSLLACTDSGVGSTPLKARPSRALNVLRASSSVALTQHPMLPSQARAIHPHGSHVAKVTLTETEKVRLQVMQVQLRLSSLELYAGPIDGMLNPETVTGVRYFQTLKGICDTGNLAAGTLSALGVPPIA